MHARMHTHTNTHTHIHIHTHTYTNHKSQSVQRNDEYKILWDFNIQKDQVLEVRSPDIVWSTSKIECQIIDFAFSCDRNIVIKEQEKIGKYQVLIIELQKVWNVKVVVIPVAIGVLGENR